MSSPPLMCSSCTEWRRSNLLLQGAGGETREAAEEPSGSEGSKAGLMDVLDEEEGGAELGG